jgi:anti-sigma B factor antagonist
MEGIMKFDEIAIGSVLVVKVLSSRVTADIAPSFKEAIINYVNRGNRKIVLDLSGVTFIDSSGLGALIGCLKVIGDDGALVLCGAGDAVVSMFKLTRMNKVFHMYGSREEAVSALS